MFSWIKKKLLIFLGDIQFMGITKPFWLIFGSTPDKVCGQELADIIEMLTTGHIFQGDIVLRSSDHYVDSYVIPGSLTHSGVFIGFINKVPMIAHAVAEGVCLETFYDFVKTDHFSIVRPKGLTADERDSAAAAAFKYVGHPYDFDFRYSNDAAMYCNELTGRSYAHLQSKFKFKMDVVGFGKLKRKSLLADGIFLSDVDIIFMTESIKKLKVWDTFISQHSALDNEPLYTPLNTQH